MSDARSDRELISEPITPDPASYLVADAAAGEPPIPSRFTWRGRRYELVRVERTWKSTNAGVYHVGDVYLRRHWADVVTVCGERLRLYGERGAKPRWYLHSRSR